MEYMVRYMVVLGAYCTCYESESVMPKTGTLSHRTRAELRAMCILAQRPTFALEGFSTLLVILLVPGVCDALPSTATMPETLTVSLKR